MTKRKTIRKDDTVRTSDGQWGLVWDSDRKRKRASVFLHKGRLAAYDWSDLTLADIGTGITFVARVYGFEDGEHYKACLELYQECEKKHTAPPGRAAVAFLLSELVKIAVEYENERARLDFVQRIRALVLGENTR